MFNLTINPTANTNANTNFVVSGTYGWQPSLQTSVDSGTLTSLPAGNSQSAMSGTWQFTNTGMQAGQHLISIFDPDSGLTVSQNVNIVTPPPPPPPVPSVTISHGPASVIVGNTVTLSWSSNNATIATINQGIGNVVVSGSTVVSPLANTTYTITVTGPGGSANATTTAIVLPVPVVIPPPNVVYISPGVGSFTIAKNVYSLDINGNCVENGKFIPGGSGTSQMAGYNNTVYGQDASSKTWWIWNQTSWSGPVTAPPPVTPPPPPPPNANTESNSNTVITTTNGTIYDSNLNAWTLVNLTGFPFLVANNGVADTRTSNVTELLYFNHTVYQENKLGNWYYDTVNGTWNGPVADPRIVVPPPPPTGNFSVVNGQLISPTGTPFKAKGVCMSDQSMISASTILATWPHTNIVNFALGSENGGYATAIPLNQIISVINDVTSKGMIIILSDYVPGQPGPRTGSDLSNMAAWYASLASATKTNPYVWFTTSNEIAGPVGPMWSATYNAIRGAGNGNMIWLESAWGSANHTFDSDPTIPPTMTNVGYNIHCYAGNFSGTTRAAAAASVSSIATMWQNFATSKDGIMPVLAGEQGPSSNGTDIDDTLVNGVYLMMQAVDDTTTNGLGGFAGETAWVVSFNNGGYNGGDAMLQPNTLSNPKLTTWGQQVVNNLAANPPG